MYKPVYNFMPLEDAEWPIPGEQGWRSGGAVVGALASHQCGPGSIPARFHMWVAFAAENIWWLKRCSQQDIPL